MHRVDTATAIAALPSLNPVGTPGFFSQGSPTGSPPATVPGQDWFNSVQEELAATVLGAGIALSKSNNGQLLQAIRLMVSAAAITGSSRKLYIGTNAALPLSRLDVSADEIIVKDTGGVPAIIKLLSVVVDIGVVGLNGLDAGTEAAGTWYYVWAIANAAGSTGCILSTSTTAPTMPGGYTFKALIGVVRNEVSGDFLHFRQYGKKILYNTMQSLLAAGTATVETAVNTTALIPPIAATANLQGKSRGTDVGGGIGHTAFIRVTTGVNYLTRAFNGTAGSGTDSAFFYSQIPIVGPDIYYLLSATTGSNNQIQLDVEGYEIP